MIKKGTKRQELIILHSFYQIAINNFFFPKKVLMCFVNIYVLLKKEWMRNKNPEIVVRTEGNTTVQNKTLSFWLKSNTFK